MKNLTLLVVTGLVMASCGSNTADNSKARSDSAIVDTGTSVNSSGAEVSPATDTSVMQGRGTDKIPSRTGTTGQGNTTVTGSATGSPTGAGKKDTTK